MDYESGLKSSLYLEWRTERPVLKMSRRSSSFCLSGATCYLSLDMQKSQNYTNYYTFTLKLCPADESKHLENCCEVEVLIIKYEPGEVTAYDKRTSNIQEIPVIIAAYSEYTEFHAYLVEWRILLSFDKQFSLQLKDETSSERRITIDLSTQTDAVCLPTSDDKCIQVSVGTPSDSVQLCDDLSNLLEKEILPDVTLNCDGQTRLVHRSILSARSEVFYAMFRNKMVESETGAVDIEDLNMPVLDMLLKYVYSGTIPDLCDCTALCLYEAGDKYKMETLKRACSLWMIQHLTEENCVSFLTAADTHGDVEFRDALVAFIYDHPAVFTSDAWLGFCNENFKLSNKVMQCYIAAKL